MLSPILFNLYINDLALLLNNAGNGVNLDGVKVNVLLYANDLVLWQTEQDLQAMLDKLHQWYMTCCIGVNTKVIYCPFSPSIHGQIYIYLSHWR